MTSTTYSLCHLASSSSQIILFGWSKRRGRSELFEDDLKIEHCIGVSFYFMERAIALEYICCFEAGAKAQAESISIGLSYEREIAYTINSEYIHIGVDQHSAPGIDAVLASYASCPYHI